LNYLFNKNQTNANYKYYIFIIIFLVFFPFPKFGDELIWGPLTNSVHIGLGVIFFVILRFYFINHNYTFYYDLCIFFISLTVALFIEIVQPIFGRSNSIEDLTLSMIGGIIVLLILYKNQIKYKKLTITCAFFGIFFTALLPIYRGFHYSRIKTQNFPKLVFPNFELNKLVSASDDVELLRDVGNCSLLFEARNLYDGIEIPLGIQNWSLFKDLVIEGYSLNSTNSKIGVRVDGNGSSYLFEERFNGKHVVGPGKFSLVTKISDIQEQVQSKKFSINKIKRIIIFKYDSEEFSTICINNIFLK
jgi:glycopeptide antibiotics resistance protein